MTFEGYEDLYLRLAKLNWGREVSLEELQTLELPVAFGMMESILDNLHQVDPQDWARRLGIFLPEDPSAQISVILNNLPDSLNFILRDSRPSFDLWSSDLSKFSMAELIDFTQVLPLSWNRTDLINLIRALRGGDHLFYRVDTPAGKICRGNLFQQTLQDDSSFEGIRAQMFRAVLFGTPSKKIFEKSPQELKNEQV